MSTLAVAKSLRKLADDTIQVKASRGQPWEGSRKAIVTALIMSDTSKADRAAILAGELALTPSQEKVIRKRKAAEKVTKPAPTQQDPYEKREAARRKMIDLMDKIAKREVSGLEAAREGDGDGFDVPWGDVVADIAEGLIFQFPELMQQAKKADWTRDALIDALADKVYHWGKK